jgi:hypothetical protein
MARPLDAQTEGNHTNLNGARFGTPSFDNDETNATGRGTTADVNNLYASFVSVFSKSQVFHFSWSSFIHSRAIGVFADTPSPSFHWGLGGLVIVNNDLEVRGLGRLARRHILRKHGAALGFIVVV